MRKTEKHLEEDEVDTVTSKIYVLDVRRNPKRFPLRRRRRPEKSQ